jgi:hypothetical protein
MNPAELVGYPWEEARKRLEGAGWRWTVFRTQAPERFRLKELRPGEDYVVRARGRDGESEVVITSHPGGPEAGPD